MHQVAEFDENYDSKNKKALGGSIVTPIGHTKNDGSQDLLHLAYPNNDSESKDKAVFDGICVICICNMEMDESQDLLQLAEPNEDLQFKYKKV